MLRKGKGSVATIRPSSPVAQRGARPMRETTHGGEPTLAL